MVVMGQWQPTSALARVVSLAGFDYDPAQDIIYSQMDPLQRQFGYAYGYDVAALGMSAVIDCEPFFFDYDNKHWMIELWKGQYGVETGCEIGVYNRAIDNNSVGYQLLDAAIGGTRPDDSAPSHNLFFDCAGPGELLNMSLTLHRNGQPLFSRGPEPHWWLTGFKWGVLSKPEDLTVDINIELKDAAMRDAFLGALQARGYQNVQVSGNAVSFTFDKPTAQQPRDQTPAVAQAAMAADERIVDAYNALGFPNNDPNQVQADFLQMAGLELLRFNEYYGRLATRLGIDLGHAAQDVVNALSRVFGVLNEEVYEWLGGALTTLEGWVGSIQQFFHLSWDDSCYVEIDNTAGTGDLVRVSATANNQSTYGVNPPSWIPKGEVGRFVLHDPKLSGRGSDGSAVYRYATADFKTGTATMSYTCPYFGWYDNDASVSGGPFRLEAKSGGGGWQGSVPAGGHPLYVRFIATGA
jgi:hypothetical protein